MKVDELGNPNSDVIADFVEHNQNIIAAQKAIPLNRDGLTAYFDQMATDGKVETTVEWLVDISLLIQDDVGKRLKAKWSPCCPSCNFKRIENDSSHFVTFSEEYCGNRECDCHGARHTAATAEGIPQADGWVAVDDGTAIDVGEYLVTLDGGAIRTALIDGSGVWHDPDFGASYDIDSEADVIAYRELPTPYQRPSREGDSNER